MHGSSQTSFQSPTGPSPNVLSGTVNVPSSVIAHGIDLYFQYCHRQPIWCFDREDALNTGSLPEELVCSILALTSRFSEVSGDAQHYAENAKRLVTQRMGSGTVRLETIESLCLLAYSSFLGRVPGSERNWLIADFTRWKRTTRSLPPWACFTPLQVSNVGPWIDLCL